MYKIAVFATLVGFVVALPVGPTDEASAVVNNYKSQINADGTYTYQFDTSNGISVQENGSPNVVQGAVQYQSPEGEAIQLNYVADENGFQPTGSHIPVDHPIPEYIVRALEYIRTHPPPEEPHKLN